MRNGAEPCAALFWQKGSLEKSGQDNGNSHLRRRQIEIGGPMRLMVLKAAQVRLDVPLGNMKKSAHLWVSA